MKLLKVNLTILCLLICIGTAYNQEPEQPETDKKKEDRRTARDPFQNSVLLEQQTFVANNKKSFEFVMQHRFGVIRTAFDNEEFDLLGLFGGSNVRLGLNYGIFDFSDRGWNPKLQIGIGTSKYNLSQDLNWKLALLQQTRANRIPISITYYGNAVVEARKKDNYKKAVHRFNYFHQLIVGRKFHKAFSLQVFFNYAHFNVVDSSTFIPEGEAIPVKHDRKHDNFAVGLSGRIKVSPQTSVLFEYTHTIAKWDMVDRPEPNLALGVEIATSSHAFQVFVSSYQYILPQHNMVYNANRFWEGEFLLGFNITRLWNF